MPRSQQVLHQRWLWGAHCVQVTKSGRQEIHLGGLKPFHHKSKQGYQWSHKWSNVLEIKSEAASVLQHFSRHKRRVFDVELVYRDGFYSVNRTTWSFESRRHEKTKQEYTRIAHNGGPTSWHEGLWVPSRVILSCLSFRLSILPSVYPSVCLSVVSLRSEHHRPTRVSDLRDQQHDVYQSPCRLRTGLTELRQLQLGRRAKPTWLSIMESPAGHAA